MSENVPGRRGRGRRPAAEVRAAVLTAAGRILLRDGMRAVTFDRVATEAGASKTTLYRWWPSPGALAAEAYFVQSRQVLELPDTGDVRADLITQLTAFVRWLKDEGAEQPVSELVGAAQMDPDLARAWSQTYAQPRRELARERLRVAQRDGQLREDADLDIIVDQLWGACYHRLLVLKVPFDESIATHLVDHALYGSAPRTANHPEPATARHDPG
ncbi:MAG TPA: TetR/AcrR family transcriptional regulator C-terminal ligand-binding domain-containing protein [Actinophytocola sp.]|uniref:TetR/AcrR family transcriptional regulator n=1 Tax=Actinophytocola sp. TaxID=1872138 RepID=UPI002DDD0547|nr:TetR/AcrR family transcriptional regulator C-terminal ligand-binding domain-containing protein [Actinophytocola sp.]HEV2782856.1 TetR/AcrR family transcriptional regulator C-terminal ligand-binding domain-containing protein [Actinophytocola sp.]